MRHTVHFAFRAEPRVITEQHLCRQLIHNIELLRYFLSVQSTC
jgi:hypothetical protein